MSLISVGPPSAPFCPKILIHSLNLLELSWVAPNASLCVASYKITLTNVAASNATYVYKAASNSTSLEISDLILGAVYTFIVAGVDTGGRMGENSVPSELVLFDGKLTYCTHHQWFVPIA